MDSVNTILFDNGTDCTFHNAKVLLDEGEVALRAKVRSIKGLFTEGNERKSLSKVSQM